jgi:tetratricopeptide (TPR) repeat protein
MSLLKVLCGAALTAASAVVLASPPHYTTEMYKTAIARCMQAGDMDCAEKNWLQVIRLQPNDGNAYANLGIVRNHRDDHAGAIKAFEKAIDLGEGTYDLFSYYADSLAKVGRTDEAIDWSYKALEVVPKLVDVRGSLAKLLVQKKRYYEALALLESFDDHLESVGEHAYFEGQRISIETALARNESAAIEQRTQMRVPKLGDHFYAPVTLGTARPQAFVVDTGASRTVVDDDLLAQSKVHYQQTRSVVPMRTADGRVVKARAVTVDQLKVGPYTLKDENVIVCKGCVPLLGQSALKRFDLQSTKVQGVEFLTLAPRH